MKGNIINNKLLQYQSLFWTPDYVDAASAWIEHIPFAFWIVEVLRPKIIVELGVHTATSYFSFCQAVKRLNIDTACYGVDTWKGDEHAGFYGEDIFEKVTSHNTKEFYRFSTLIRSTFDDAKEYFIDTSIDLLHIDGFHSYEAVKHDFEAWFPKLSKNSFVFFHDINVRERDFGVFKFWEELKSQYAHFQVDFGHGLGVICIGKIIHEELKELFESGPFSAFLRNIFSERGNFFKTNSFKDLTLEALVDRSKTLELNNSQITTSNETLQSQNAQLVENSKALELTNAQLTEKSVQLTENKKALELINDQIEASHKELTEKYERLKGHYTNLESSAQRLHERYQKELESSARTSEELAAIKRENELLKKYITWYRDTYENRSILGVLKEKIKLMFKKKSDLPSKEDASSKTIIDNTNTPIGGKAGEGKFSYSGTLNIRYQAEAPVVSQVCIFSSFSYCGDVEEYVFYYLVELKKAGFPILFVSTSTLPESSVSRLSQYAYLIIERENKCPDFGSWKAGLSLLNWEKLDSILLANDSVFGPFFDLGRIISSMKNRYEVWGMTDNYEIDYHLQSYFLYFNKRAIKSNIFNEFWTNVNLSATKDEVIHQYEVGISKLFRNNGFKLGAYADIEVISKGTAHGRKVINPLLVFAKSLIKKYQFPFFKRELLIKRNISRAYDHLNFYMNVAGWRKTIKENTSYPISYIEDFIGNYYKVVKASSNDIVLRKRKILFLSDTAAAGEPQRLLINFLQWLKEQTSICIEILICHQGNNHLAAEFTKLGVVTNLYSLSEEERTSLKRRLVDEIYLVFSNTIHNLETQKYLSFLEVPQIIYIHEHDPILRDILSADNIEWIRKNVVQLIASTDIIKTDVARYIGIDEEEVSLVDKFVTLTEYSTCNLEKECEKLISNLGIPPGAFIVGMSGKLDGEDLTSLLPVISMSLCKENEDIHIVWLVAGPDGPSYQTIRSDLERAGLSNRVHLIEEMADVAPFFTLSDVFVNCSRENFLSLSVLENGVIGNPVIYFENSQGSDKYARLGMGHSVPYLNIEALSEKISAFYRVRPGLKSENHLTRDIIKNNFATHILAPRLLQIINRYYDAEELMLAEDPLLTFMTHIYYDNSWTEIRDKLRNFNNGRNYFLFSISEGCIMKSKIIEDIKETFANAYFLVTPNVGKDIGGKLALIDLYLFLGIKSSYMVMLHDKQSLHSLIGESWKNELFKVFDINNLPLIMDLFRDPTVGVVGTKKWIINEYDPVTGNFKNNNQVSKRLLKQFHISIENFDFMGGCIFWIKSSIIEEFFTKNNSILMRGDLEAGNVMDLHGERVAHTWERMFSWIAANDGYRIEGI